MSARETLRENWRLVFLVVLVLASTFALFVPGASDDAGATNLEYGLELSGGTRVRAPLVGLTVAELDIDPNRTREVTTTVAGRTGVSLTDVRVDAIDGTVEVFADPAHGNVTRAEFVAALRAAGFENVQPGDVRDGVTEDTRQRTVTVLNDKINQAGLTGGSATVSRSATGRTFVIVEVPGANRSQVLDLIGSQGRVSIVATFPQNGSYRRVPLLTQGDFAQIGTATEGRGQRPPYVPVSLNDEAAANFSAAMRAFGFTSQRGIENCRYEQNASDPGYCLLTVQDNRTVFASSMGGDLARVIENREFVQDPAFRMTASNISEARELQLNLQAGALPTTLDISGEGTTTFVGPSLAETTKLFSLITGFIAVLAVSVVVFIRYREPGVALPMIVTATAEVYLLLGFAAAVGLALDLSHIAGFIAVIGTGVDDLVIIADEILQRGEIRTGKVFASRFRKAFWVIGAAAATTIIAMSPLAVLSLGDLRGFAIVTIVGVLLGVLVTRPAYGNILRNVVVD